MNLKNFIAGMGSINLFPEKKKFKFVPFNFHILSDSEAFKKDLEAVGQDMWNAVKIIEKEQL